MIFCKRCLYNSKHPLFLTIDEDGICSGCRVHEEKDELNWFEREKKLITILDNYRNKNSTNYDCIIPVSGARDSFFIVHKIKTEYGLNPLLVTYNKQYNTSTGVRNLAKLRTVFDCDILTLTVDPNKVKKITRATLRRFGSIYWHVLAGQTVFPVQIAVRMKIPLIVWGVHQGVDQVGMFSHLDEVEMTRKYRKEHDLMGFEAEDLIDNEFDFVTKEDVNAFVYPDDKEIEKVGVRGIYLSNYIRWDSRSQHEKMIDLYGYETASQSRTFDTYNDVDCWNYSDVHDYLKLIKHGYGKVLDHATREIRLKHMDRSTAINLIKKYMYTPPKNLSPFLEWIGMTENAFNFVVDQFRNPLFWERDDEYHWQLKILPYGLDSDTEWKVSDTTYKDFILTPKGQSADKEDNYILIGKGTV
jgi:N-acetyl sugar amidotransferase